MHDYLKRREENDSPGTRERRPVPAAVRHVTAGRAIDWLSRGARDIVACGGRSLVFGFCYVAAGHAIARAHASDAAWREGFVWGFLLLGPLLAVGTYELSRQRERGEPAELLVALFAWCRNPRGLGLYAVLLGAVLMLWLELSWALLGGTDAASGLAAAASTAPTLWWVVWTVFAVLAFATGVVSAPMLLDREIGVPGAVRASLVCCRVNPVAMSLWAATTASLVGVSLWLDFWPLLIVGPWIGHATWHVYRDCIGDVAVPSSRQADGT